MSVLIFARRSQRPRVSLEVSSHDRETRRNAVERRPRQVCRGHEEDRRGRAERRGEERRRDTGGTLKADSVGVYLRRSTRWTSGRALCRTLRRWFPFSFFSLFLSLSSSSSFFPPSPRSSFLVHSSPPPSVRLSPPPSIASFSPSGQDSFADRADRHGGHAAILRDDETRGGEKLGGNLDFRPLRIFR